jgi:putative heme-binding domain-containing protein
MRNAKIIVPGDPYRSVLMYRMSKLGYARMPYIGSQVVDSRGVALIDEWIRSLPAGDDAGSNSAPSTQGTPEAGALVALSSKSAAGGNAAVRQLVQSTEGALALVARMHAGALDPAEFNTAVSLGSKSSSDISGLFETFIPEPQRRKRLGPNPQPEAILSLDGNVARGKLIFHSDAARCRNCHDISDPGKSLGPTLREINKKYPRRSEMLQHALNPSEKIDDKFAAYLVVTADGRLVTGLLLEQTAQSIQLKTSEGKVLSINADDIDEIQKSKRSLMPEQILSDLTAQEAADLIAYLGSLGAAP